MKLHVAFFGADKQKESNKAHVLGLLMRLPVKRMVLLRIQYCLQSTEQKKDYTYVSATSTLQSMRLIAGSRR